MKHAAISLLIIVLFLSLASSASAQRNKAVDRALKLQYPDAKTQVIGTHDVNGVKVDEVRVTTDAGQSTAEITDAGDFLVSGMPVRSNEMPSAVNDALTGLFKTNPQTVERLISTSYHVQVDTNGRKYDLRFDPVGRLRDINNEAEIKRADLSKTDPSTSENANRVRQLASKRYNGAKVTEIHLYPTAGEGYYIATVDTEDGPVEYIANSNGDVYAQNERLDQKDLPKPIADAIDKMFGNVKIQKVQRTTYEFYQFNTRSAGGEEVTVRIHPNGDILSVNNMQASRDDAARTAKSQQSPTNNDRNSDTDTGSSRKKSRSNPSKN